MTKARMARALFPHPIFAENNPAIFVLLSDCGKIRNLL